MSDTSETLEQALTQPKSASHDGQSVTARDAAELIALDDHLSRKTASAARKLPFRIVREVLPGPG